jgi:hypothetical protein
LNSKTQANGTSTQEKKKIKNWHEIPVSTAWEHLYNWATNSPTASRRSDDYYSNMQVASWAIHALSQLIACAKTEDHMGVILNTNTLPTVLCTLIECVFANDEFARAYPLRSRRMFARIMQLPVVNTCIMALAHSRRNFMKNGLFDRENLAVYHMSTQPHALADDLNTCVYILVSTYYENLSYFTFPPRIAAKIQSYTDFKE